MLDDGVLLRARRPRIPADVVRRPRLSARILEGIAGPLTLACAPAGFGKTIALATALEGSTWPVIWLTLDAAASSLLGFVRSFVVTIGQHYPDSCRSTISLLQLSQVPRPPALAQALEEDLNGLPEDCVIVLDDYHLVTGGEVDALLIALLQRLPPQVHLVVASRTLPPWPLASLRVAGLLAELDGEDLRFTRSETQAFLRRATGTLIDEATSATVYDQMGGWSAAVRLAAIALRKAPDAPGSLPSLAQQAEPQVIQYLLDEVVAKQPRPIAEFLLPTAICDRITPALGDALLADGIHAPDSAAMLQQLQQAGLFITREQAAGDWYRYHDLLRAALERGLRQQYDSAQIQGLHARASAWFAREGRVPEAVRHALAANAPDTAAALVEARIPAALERHQWALVAEWLELLPADLVEERPALLLAAGWVAHRRLQYDRLLAILDRLAAWCDPDAQRLPADRVRALEAECDALRAAYYQRLGDAPRAFDLAGRAWERLPNSAAHARGQAGCTLGLAAQQLGHAGMVEELVESDRAVELRAYPAATLHVRLAVMHTYLATGDLRACEREAIYVVRRATDLGLGFLAAWTAYILGWIYYEWDRLDAAAEHFGAVVEHRDSAPIYALRGSLQGLALTRLAMGEPLTGSDTAAQLLALREGPCFVEGEIGRAFEARLAWWQGSRDAALDWLRSTPYQSGKEPAFARETASITWLELLLAEGAPSETAAAGRRVVELRTAYRALHDTVHEITLLTLQAVAAEAQGHHEAALSALEDAVQCGMPGGFVRTFADRGPALARLLAKLPTRVETQEYVARLRAACGAPRAQRVAPVPHREAMLADLTEPLTTREQEVLALLVGRLSNKEIANTLSVSWQTVAKHTANIYQKLRVAGRRDAVARAEALGIIARADRTISGT